ncbi:beta-ketoacyl synthase N-terminal-like domain-containing protein [Streptococcus gordonii]|jgi:beta-ketoacyl synthase, N-terminal domain|uniref:beta-ketoacyl synthase N-terminal-like domain-containing protein n=1 Tax=Streptococcus gordonii TaxID=1302 RepID=UPI000779BE54|nr:beta-ketoacyl synthase N-terminal-like domain-containing protein [Streptococcus gordonii]VTT23662.1 3-oxoacyl-ACP synthase [Streptococcus gordonii]
MNRYFITGYGLLLPGISKVEELWNLLKCANSFNKTLNTISHDEIESLLPQFPYIDKKKVKHSDLQTVFHLMAVHECLEKSSLTSLLDDKVQVEISKRIGVVSGSMFAQMNFGIEQVAKVVETQTSRISPYTGMAFYYGSNVGELSCLLGTRGENCATLGGTSLVLDGIDIAEAMIDYNRNDIVLVGGGENVDYELVRESLLGQISEDNDFYTLLPYYNKKKGVTLTNGAAIIMLESEKSASQRDVKQYAAISNVVTVNNVESLFQTDESIVESYYGLIDKVLKENQLTKDDISIVIPSGESNTNTDFLEAKALKQYFYNRSKFVYTPRSVVGNSMGVSCALDIIVASMMINKEETLSFPYKPHLKDEKLRDIFIYNNEEQAKIERILIIHKNWTDGKLSGVIVSKVKKRKENYENS